MSTSDTRRTKLTYDEYVLFPNDGNRHEIIDGRHYMNPAPSPRHQTASKRLQYLLYTKIELAGLGLVFDAPIDVHLDEFTVVQPDLVVLVAGSKAQVTETKVKGAPDMLVEILSPRTCDYDRRLKRQAYQSAGVREYWIVDPMDNRVHQFVLEEGQYRELPQSDNPSLAVLPQVAIPLGEVW